MKYDQIIFGEFIARPNRFIAHVRVAGETVRCHVPTTGRLGELLVSGAQVVLKPAQGPARKTAYSLIAVYRDTGVLFNIDSLMPNRLFKEWALSSSFVPAGAALKSEYTHGDSRFDFCIENAGERTLIEVKGVTLLEGPAALFPDAPTQRGTKHLQGLTCAAKQGMEAWAVFVVLFGGAEYFAPNEEKDPAFALALRRAKAAGVHILILEADVKPDEVRIVKELPIKL